jgi:phosphomevalonate kinase
MSRLRFIVLLILIFSLTNCEKKEELVDKTVNAQIVAFHAEKLYCYWGWDIKIGSETIKADSIPDLKPWADTIFPISGKITIGSKTRSCGSKGLDYYEIKEFIVIK